MPAEFKIQEKEFNLGDLIMFNVADKKKQIVDVSITASQESILREQLTGVRRQMHELEFKVSFTSSQSSQGADIYKIIDIDDVQEVLDESLEILRNI